VRLERRSARTRRNETKPPPSPKLPRSSPSSSPPRKPPKKSRGRTRRQRTRQRRLNRQRRSRLRGRLPQKPLRRKLKRRLLNKRQRPSLRVRGSSSSRDRPRSVLWIRRRRHRARRTTRLPDLHSSSLNSSSSLLDISSSNSSPWRRPPLVNRPADLPTTLSACLPTRRWPSLFSSPLVRCPTTLNNSSSSNFPSSLANSNLPSLPTPPFLNSNSSLFLPDLLHLPLTATALAVPLAILSKLPPRLPSIVKGLARSELVRRREERCLRRARSRQRVPLWAGSERSQAPRRADTLRVLLPSEEVETRLVGVEQEPLGFPSTTTADEHLFTINPISPPVRQTASSEARRAPFLVRRRPRREEATTSEPSHGRRPSADLVTSSTPSPSRPISPLHLSNSSPSRPTLNRRNFLRPPSSPRPLLTLTPPRPAVVRPPSRISSPSRRSAPPPFPQTMRSCLADRQTPSGARPLPVSPPPLGPSRPRRRLHRPRRSVQRRLSSSPRVGSGVPVQEASARQRASWAERSLRALAVWAAAAWWEEEEGNGAFLPSFRLASINILPSPRRPFLPLARPLTRSRPVSASSSSNSCTREASLVSLAELSIRLLGSFSFDLPTLPPFFSLSPKSSPPPLYLVSYLPTRFPVHPNDLS
jgi:hypothetical protein